MKSTGTPATPARPRYWRCVLRSTFSLGPDRIRTLRRILSRTLAAASLGVSLAGCTGMMTRKAIDQFSTAMQTQDFNQLKESSSLTFERKALRLPESAKDLKVLRLPTGKITIISEEKIDEHTKKVVVEVGEKERTRQLQYLLKKDVQFAHWVVDDIVVTQKDSDGEEVSRKVTEQMDLLLTCREFLGSWRDGAREQQLAFCTEELKQELQQLPAGWQTQLTASIAGNGRDRTFRPEALLNDDRAGLRLEHPDGTLILDFRQQADGTWLVNDAALEPSGKDNDDTGIRSVAKLAKTLNRSVLFLQAYAADNETALQDTASKDFYERCLKGADLTTINVPVPELLAAKYEVKQFKDRTEILLDTDRSTWLVTLSAPLETHGTVLTRGGEQRVHELTEFTTDGQVKPLSAMFLAHDIVTLYSKALCSDPENRNIDQLKHLSSVDFKARVWEDPAAHLLKIVSIAEVEGDERKIISTRFRGDLTEVTVAQGKSILTFVLVQNGNWLSVDDVMISSYARPASLKANLELLLPVYAFASAAHTSNLRGLMDVSSQNLDQMVWTQVGTVPELSKQLAAAIMYPVKAVQPGDPWSIVQTGDDTAGTEIRLIRQGNRYVVDSMTLIDGPTPEQHVDILKSLRNEIAARTLGPRSGRKPGAVMQANHFEAADLRNGVSPASYEAEFPADIRTGVSPASFESPASEAQ